MRACADPSRPHGWINEAIVSAYGRLHDLGWAHSVEVWSEGDLVGGLYGVSIGGLFAGESMFHQAPDASKVALVRLTEILADTHAGVLDVQWQTDHLSSLGAVEVPRHRLPGAPRRGTVGTGARRHSVDHRGRVGADPAKCEALVGPTGPEIERTIMSFHHVALATARMADTHSFYTEAMGFELVKAVVAPAPEGNGWAKHVFYDTGDGRDDGPGLIAFWDLHGDFPEVDGAMSSAVGLPTWVNHLAFYAADDAHLDACRKRWIDLGLDVVEIDHGFCRSIYTNDPNGTAVEWCLDTRPFDEGDRRRAIEALESDAPEFDSDPPDITFHEGDPTKVPAWALPA